MGRRHPDKPEQGEKAKIKTAIITQAEFDSLPEYSVTVPTGQVVGKRWKSYSRIGQWCVREYIRQDEEGYFYILTKMIRIKPPNPDIMWPDLPWEKDSSALKWADLPWDMPRQPFV